METFRHPVQTNNTACSKVRYIQAEKRPDFAKKWWRCDAQEIEDSNSIQLYKQNGVTYFGKL